MPARRHIFKFIIPSADGNVTIYAKRANEVRSAFYDPPSYRLTKIANVQRTSSYEEATRFQKLAEIGVAVPTVVGIYRSGTEEFVFVEEVKGQTPDKCLETHRDTIIRQDAEILATLCLMGFAKSGFTDFDDKIFDGHKLWLIDVDEFEDIYPSGIDFRGVLLDHKDLRGLIQFRALQKQIFLSKLTNAIFDYQGTLLISHSQVLDYIRHFYNRIGYPPATQEEIDNITIANVRYGAVVGFTL